MDSSDDIISKIRKQEELLKKQRDMKEKLLEQQQHKQFLNNQTEIEENDKNLIRFERTASVDKQKQINIVQPKKQISEVDDIEQQIINEIKRKEQEIEDTNNALKQEENEHIVKAVNIARNENKNQLYHYERIFKNIYDQMTTLQKGLTSIYKELHIVSTSNNKLQKRTSCSNALKSYQGCNKILTEMMEQQKHRVNYK